MEPIMTVHKLEKEQWRPFFDRLSKGLDGKQAEIEIASLYLGDQVEAEWLPLLGIVYDPKNDIIELALDGLDHMIHKPREIYIDNGAQTLMSLEIVDADGTKQISS
jgi:Family of unknown function (DUF5335)